MVRRVRARVGVPMTPDDIAVTVDLGGAILGETLTITVTGCPCRLKKVLPDVVAVLKDHKSAGVKDDARSARPKKPCGCKDA